MDKEQVAWAAGFFDGEGTTYLRTRKGKGNRNYVCPTIRIGQSGDPEVLHKFKNIFGIGRVNGPFKYREGRKPIYQYSCDSYKSAIPIIKAMWPYLSNVKKLQASKVLVAAERGRIGYEGRTYTKERPIFGGHRRPKLTTHSSRTI